MSVGMVTARTHGGIVANIATRPLSASVTPIGRRFKQPGSSRDFTARVRAAGAKRTKAARAAARARALPTRLAQAKARADLAAGIASVRASQRVQKKALGALLRLLVPRALPLVAALIPIGLYIYNNRYGSQGFPGFENINPGWRVPTVTEVPVGGYAPNAFDAGPWAGPGPESLLDSDDIGPGFSIRYWGDYGADPYAEGNAPPWIVPLGKPNPAHAPLPVRIYPDFPPRVPYRKLPNLSPRTRGQTRPRDRRFHRDNFGIEIRTKGGIKGPRSIRIRNRLPRKKLDDIKAKPANQVVFGILKAAANIGGEAKEWIDIFAEAAGYQKFDRFKFTSIMPESLHGKETQKKVYYLFFMGGINNIDFEILFELARENAVEDFLIGIAGRAGRSAARGLGLTVGPQTGPLI